MRSDSANNRAYSPSDGRANGIHSQSAYANGATGERAKLPVAICPGFHDSALTVQFLSALPSYVRPIVLTASPVSPVELHQCLINHFGEPKRQIGAVVPLVAIGFSAGVVGLAGAIALWQQQGGKLARFIAIDGWGVPLMGMPVTRLSHDLFTHATSLPLGAGDKNFFAEPGVDHLRMWGEIESVRGFEATGWQMDEGSGIPMSAGAFLRRSLHKQWNDYFSWRKH